MLPFAHHHNPTDRPPSVDLAVVVLYSGKGMEAENITAKENNRIAFWLHGCFLVRR